MKERYDRNISNKKIDVMFVIPDLGQGGAQRVLSILLEHLDRNKIQPSCVFYNSQRVYEIPGDVEVYTLWLTGTNNLFNKIIYSIKRIFRIRKIIGIVEPDIVFSFMHTVNLVVIITKLLSNSLENELRLIISERTTPSIGLRGKMKRCHGGITKFFMKTLYPKADRIIVNSKGVKKDLVEKFNVPEEKISVIYNPLDIKKIKKLSQGDVVEHPWFDDNIPIIINVGSLSKPKAQEYLLKAFKLVREKTNCRLIFLGEGDKENELKKLSKNLRIDNDVAFLGFHSNPFKFLVKSSVFVLSSKWEGFPNVLIEAMACGVPVISTRCQSGPDEIITDSVNGLLVPVDDYEKLAEAILKVITDPDLSVSLASAAKETVSKFDVKTMIKKYESLFIHGQKKKADRGY